MAVTGFTLGGTHSSIYGVIATTVRSVKPQIEPREMSVPRRHGTYDFGNPDIGKRTFEITCAVIGASMASLRTASHAIGAWMANATTLVFDDDPTVTWSGRVYSASDMETVSTLGTFKILFEAQPLGSVATAITAAAGTNFYNSGNMTTSQAIIDATILATFAPAGQYLSFGVSGSSDFVSISSSALTKGDRIIIDLNKCKVTKNGSTIMGSVKVSSVFFQIPPGTQSINASPTGTQTTASFYPMMI